MKKTTISLTGHRPPELFGYDINSKDYDSIRRRLGTILKKHTELNDEVTCHTGMALGADTLWADVTIAGKKLWPDKVRLHAEIPHPKQKDAWKNQEARDHYDFILSQADDSTLYADEYSPWCMQARNVGMLDHGEYLIAVWNGTIKPKSGTSNAVKYATKEKDGYYVVRPDDNYVRWDKSNPSLLKMSGHKDFSLIDSDLKEILHSYKFEGYSMREVNGKYYLKNADDTKRLLIEKVHEVLAETKTRRYDIHTIKTYEFQDSILMNIDNKTYIDKLT